MFLNAVKSHVGASRWSTDPKVPGRVLTVTYINSFLITMRLMIGSGIAIDFPTLSQKLKGIEDFDFSAFHSSQYGRMATAIYEEHFSK